jgi:hypothetical protein
MSRPEAITNVYTGPTRESAFSRTYHDVEHSVGQLFSFEEGINRVLKNTSGLRKTFLDLGCGSSTTLESVARLQAIKAAKRKSFSFELRGFTDAPSAQKQGRLNLVKPELMSYYYTLTAQQTLDRFFQLAHIKELHFAWASYFFMYLSPNVLDHTFNSLIDRLVPGGELLVVNIGNSYGPLPSFEASQHGILRVKRPEMRLTNYSLSQLHNYLYELPASSYSELVSDQVWPTVEKKLNFEYQKLLAITKRILPDHITPDFLECLKDEAFSAWFTTHLEHPVQIPDHRERLEHLKSTMLVNWFTSDKS